MPLPSFLQPIGPIAGDGAAKPPVVLRDKVLAFTMEQQLQKEWCWAANAASISNYFTSDSQWSAQCQVAGACLNQTCCVTPAPCDLPYYLDKALEVTGNFAAEVDGSVSFKKVLDQIETGSGNGAPVGCHITWNGGGGHFIAIFGYCYLEIEGIVQLEGVFVGDPFYGPSVITYQALENYRNAGNWNYTYYTITPS